MLTDELALTPAAAAHCCGLPRISMAQALLEKGLIPQIDPKAFSFNILLKINPSCSAVQQLQAGLNPDLTF